MHIFILWLTAEYHTCGHTANQCWASCLCYLTAHLTVPCLRTCDLRNSSCRLEKLILTYASSLQWIASGMGNWGMTLSQKRRRNGGESGREVEPREGWGQVRAVGEGWECAEWSKGKQGIDPSDSLRHDTPEKLMIWLAGDSRAYQSQSQTFKEADFQFLNSGNNYYSLMGRQFGREVPLLSEQQSKDTALL